MASQVDKIERSRSYVFNASKEWKSSYGFRLTEDGTKFMRQYSKYTSVNQKVKAIFKLRGNWNREELAHCAVLIMPVEEFSHVQYSTLPSVEWQQRGRKYGPPLQDCTIEEQRGVVWFLWAEGAKPVEIHRRMLAQYGQSTTSQRKVYEWVERFKSGRTRVTDEGLSGRSSTSRSRKASSSQAYRN